MKVTKLFLLLLIPFISCISIKILAQGIESPSNIIHITEKNSPIVLHDSINYIIRLESQYCNWCHVMERMVFKNEEIQKRLTDNVQVLRLDINERTSIVFEGKNYQYLESIKMHGLAVYLSENKMSLPIVIFINKSKNIHTIHRGYILYDEFKKHLDAFLLD